MIDVHHLDTISMDCSMTEFVGTTVLDTIGLVIPGTSPALLARMDLKKPYRSLGLLSSRTGAAGQINAVDEAVKSTNTEVVPSNFRGTPKAGAGTATLSSSAATTSPMCGAQSRFHWNSQKNMPENFTSAKPDIWNLLIPPMRARRFTWHLTRRLEDRSDFSAALLPPSGL